MSGKLKPARSIVNDFPRCNVHDPGAFQPNNVPWALSVMPFGSSTERPSVRWIRYPSTMPAMPKVAMNAVTPKYDTITPFNTPTRRPNSNASNRAANAFFCHDAPKIAPPPTSVNGMCGQVRMYRP